MKDRRQSPTHDGSGGDLIEIMMPTLDGMEKVKVLPVETPALCVHPTLAGQPSFTITHIPTGMALLLGIPTLEEAITITEQLAIVDWTKDYKEFYKDVEATGILRRFNQYRKLGIKTAGMGVINKPEGSILP